MITKDKNITIVSDLIVGHTYEVAVVARDGFGHSQDMESAPRAVVTIGGKVDGPAAPTGLVAVSAMFTIFLEWVNPLDPDLDYVEIWRGESDDDPSVEGTTSMLLANVKSNHYADNLGAAGVTRYYWVRVRNSSGIYSGFNAVAGVAAISGAVVATSVSDFAITATKMFTNTVVLSADVWTNNSPSAGYIAWNAHTIVYGGAAYAISAGNTSSKYVVWTIGATTYTVSTTHPTSGFTIAYNTAGVHTLVWNNSANMVIGSAFIGSLDAAKITSGSIPTTRTDAKNTNPLADQTSANTAADTAKVQGYTLIEGGYIKADYITATNITAGTLSGRTVQTAASGQRVVVSSADNSLGFYYGAEAVPYVFIGAGGVGIGVIQLTDGTGLSRMESTGYLHLSGGAGILCESPIVADKGSGFLFQGTNGAAGSHATVFSVNYLGTVVATGFQAGYAAGIDGTCTVKVGGLDKTLTFTKGIVTGLA